MTTNHSRSITRPVAQMLRVPLTGRSVLVLAPASDQLTAVVMQLAADDIEVITAPTAQAAAARLRETRAAAVLLAAELDGGTGFAALEALRANDIVPTECPAIAFSEQSEPLNRLRALQRGCVDFLAVPIFYPELLARLQIALSRTTPQRVQRSLPGGLEINETARTVHVRGEQVVLARYEFQLLITMAVDPERVWTKAELLRAVWGYEKQTRTRTLDSHACRLREKLRDTGGSYIHTAWGTGYRLLVNVEA